MWDAFSHWADGPRKISVADGAGVELGDGTTTMSELIHGLGVSATSSGEQWSEGSEQPSDLQNEVFEASMLEQALGGLGGHQQGVWGVFEVEANEVDEDNGSHDGAEREPPAELPPKEPPPKEPGRKCRQRLIDEWNEEVMQVWEESEDARFVSEEVKSNALRSTLRREIRAKALQRVKLQTLSEGPVHKRRLWALQSDKRIGAVPEAKMWVLKQVWIEWEQAVLAASGGVGEWMEAVNGDQSWELLRSEAAKLLKAQNQRVTESTSTCGSTEATAEEPNSSGLQIASKRLKRLLEEEAWEEAVELWWDMEGEWPGTAVEAMGEMPELVDDSTDSESDSNSDSEPELVDDATDSESESDQEDEPTLAAGFGAEPRKCEDQSTTAEREAKFGPVWREVLTELDWDGSNREELEQLSVKCVRLAAKWKLCLGEELAQSRNLQSKYLRITDAWAFATCEAAELAGDASSWPPFVEASIRDAQLCIDERVDIQRMEEFFSRFGVPKEQVNVMLEQVTSGQVLKFREPRSRVRGKMLPSAQAHLREIAAQHWVDASRGHGVIFSPRTLALMTVARVMCYPIARVPKHSTSTGLATGKGRVIAHLSYRPVFKKFMRLLSKNDSVEAPFGTYKLGRHPDIAREVLYWRSSELGQALAACKVDGNYYFRNWFMSVMNYGDIACEFSGHTVLDRSLVFGLAPSPEVTHFGGTDPIEQATNAGYVVLDCLVGELAQSQEAQQWAAAAATKSKEDFKQMVKETDPLLQLSEGDVTAQKVMGMSKLEVRSLGEIVHTGDQLKAVPITSSMYVDDSTTIAPVVGGIHLAARAHAVEALVSRLGDTGMSLKAVQEEMVCQAEQTVIGTVLDLMDDEFRPTEARLSKFGRYIEEALESCKSRTLTARGAYRVYSLGLWIGYGAYWVRPFIHGLKTPLNGFDSTAGSADDLVAPNRKGLPVAAAWLEYEQHLQTLWEFIDRKDELKWSTPLVEFLPPLERLAQPRTEFGEIESDACIWGGGACSVERKEFFRVVHPRWVREQIRYAMDSGLGESTATHYTIALVELCAVFLSHLVWGGKGSWPDVWQVVDNTNTQTWMEKLWAAPKRASDMLRGIAAIGMSRGYKTATTGRRTKEMCLADPLSRCFEHGVYHPDAMADFAAGLRTRGCQGGVSEVVIPAAVLDLVFPLEPVKDVKEHLERVLAQVKDACFKTVPWEASSDAVMEHCSKFLPKNGRDKGAGCSGVCQNGFTRAQLSPLLPARKEWEQRPTITAACYGILGALMGWVAEGFKPVVGMEVVPWCVEQCRRLFPEMQQLGDITKLKAKDLVPTDVLICGTECTAVSVCGLLKGLADPRMEHLLFAASLFAAVGYKVMIFEMVPNILAFDDGAIQLVFENRLRAAGYEVSRRIEQLYDHGSAAVRERLVTIATNPKYGSHDQLVKTLPIRIASDPKCMKDILEPHQAVDRSLFFPLSEVKFREGEVKVQEGKPCWVGSMHGGGLQFRGKPGSVKLEHGAMSTVIGSGNLGAVLALDADMGWVLRENTVTEMFRGQTLPAVLELPDDACAAMKGVGNAEPSRMAQAVARGVVGPYLESCKDMRPGIVPEPTPDRVVQTCVRQVLRGGVFGAK